MRVLLDVSAVPERPAGAGIYILALVRELAEEHSSEIDLTLLARRGDADRWASLAPAATLRPVAPRRRPVRLAWEQVAGPVTARSAGAEVWHGPHYTLPLRLQSPRVVTVHDLTFFDHPEWHERRKVVYFRRMIRAAVRQAAVVVSVSEPTTRRLQALLAPASTVLTIPHGVDHTRFTTDGDPDDDDALLATVGVRRPFVAFQGTLEPRKNVPSLVRAFARVAPAHPDLVLVLAGQPGWGVDEIDAAVADSGVADRIVRPGYVESAVVPALFRRAEAVAYPSHEEGFGLPALEALACGAAVLTTEGSPMAEVAAGTAALVPPGDDAALADGLAALLEDEALAARLRAGGPAVAARYTWERCAQAHVQAYRLAAVGSPA